MDIDIHPAFLHWFKECAVQVSITSSANPFLLLNGEEQTNMTVPWWTQTQSKKSISLAGMLINNRMKPGNRNILHVYIFRPICIPSLSVPFNMCFDPCYVNTVSAIHYPHLQEVSQRSDDPSDSIKPTHILHHSSQLACHRGHGFCERLHHVGFAVSLVSRWQSKVKPL